MAFIQCPEVEVWGRWEFLRSVSPGNWNSCGDAFEEAFVISYKGQREKLQSPQRFHPHPTRFFSVSELLWCLVQKTCSQRAAIRGKPGQWQHFWSCWTLCAETGYWASQKGITCEKMGLLLNICIGDLVSWLKAASPQSHPVICQVQGLLIFKIHLMTQLRQVILKADRNEL